MARLACGTAAPFMGCKQRCPGRALAQLARPLAAPGLGNLPLARGARLVEGVRVFLQKQDDEVKQEIQHRPAQLSIVNPG